VSNFFLRQSIGIDENNIKKKKKKF